MKPITDQTTHEEIVEMGHAREYERLRPRHPELPPWESLTDEQREKVRAANREHRKYMNDLGEAIRTGGPYPDPFGGRK